MRTIAITALVSALVTALAATVARADPPLAAEHSITCKPTQVAVFPGSRVHVKCDKPWTNPSTSAKAWYFALALTDAAAPLVQAAGDTAIGSGKKVLVYFRTDASENPGGCLTTDCRKLTGIAVVN
jgi:hypothetical protein